MTALHGPALGVPIPSLPHSISVSLPTWSDNVGYMEGEKRVVDAMVSGYPRFVIHFSVKKLAMICEQKFGASGERCLPYPSRKTADHCRAFLVDQLSQSGFPALVRLVRYIICPEDKRKVESDVAGNGRGPAASPSRVAELHIVLFPADAFPLARQCWQHAGMGISSRYAEHCLSLMADEAVQPSVSIVSHPTGLRNEHFSTKDSILSTDPPSSDISGLQPVDSPQEVASKDQSDNLEGHYSGDSLLGTATAAKHAIRRRIAGVLVRNSPNDLPRGPCGTELTEDDVFLFPTGMCAMWNAYDLVMMARPAGKTICFGFPYTDTHKILQKWGPECHFFGHGLDTDIDELENILEQEKSISPSLPPAVALFTEIPSNPLLRSADLPHLRALADKYDFLIVIDETIGNFVNVSVLRYADIIVSSMSKIFSGDANVTGGSLVLNPVGRHYRQLKTYLASSYEDLYFDEDVLHMERNSRDFERRIGVIDENAEVVCDFLRSHSIAGGMPSSAIKDIFYPKWITRDKYEYCRVRRRRGDAGDHRIDGGFGGLFSVTFTTAAASTAFFDALSCYKGPSLGTNFTLACPYTILAHYGELEWAAEYGVEETLVRISIGMEEQETLLHCLSGALKAAQGTAT